MPDPLAPVLRWDRFCDRWLPDQKSAPVPIAASRESDSPWLEDPLPLAQFVEHKQHLSSYGRKISLWKSQQDDLDAFLGVDPKKVFAADYFPEFNQAFLVWGKGAGKDFCVALVQCWIVHILLCLANPHEYLGLAPDESIDIPVIGYSQQQSRNVYFAKLKARMKAWAWLRQKIDDYAPDVGSDRWLKDSGGYMGTEHIKLPHNINCWSLTASLGSAEGKNIVFWVLDELAAFTSETKVNFAKAMHNLVVTSARTRFKHRWRGFAISFPRHKQDYVMWTVGQVRRGKISDTFVSVRATWDVIPNTTREDFKADFDRDPEDAETKLACNPPAAVDAYFRSPELLLLHAWGAPLDLLEQKLSLPTEQLEVIANLGQSPILEVDGAGDPRLDRRGFPKLARWFKGQRNPVTGDEFEYYLHLDPGLSGDSFGLAMGHIHQFPDGKVQPAIDIAFRWTGAMFHEFGEIFRQSWFLDTKNQTEEVKAAEVDFRTVREFIYYLRFARGFNIRQVSMDNWNSAESKQDLERRGFPVVYRVVAKEDYDEFKALAYNRQLLYYAYPVLIEECYKLQIINGSKVDAPRTKEGEGIKNDSHKDVSDAVAAVSRYLNYFKTDQIEFWQSPEVDQLLAQKQAEKENQPLKVEADSPTLNEFQQLLIDRFFNE